MAALTPTKIIKTEAAGDAKVYICTVTPTTAADTITFVAATHKFRTIFGCFAQIETGMTTTFTTVQAAFSGLVVTLTTKGQDGNAATTWGQIRLLLIVGSDG